MLIHGQASEATQAITHLMDHGFVRYRQVPVRGGISMAV
jgi:hypothetical protein